MIFFHRGQRENLNLLIYQEEDFSDSGHNLYFDLEKLWEL